MGGTGDSEGPYEYRRLYEEHRRCIPPQVLRYVMADAFTCSSDFSLDGMIWNTRNDDVNLRCRKKLLDSSVRD